MYHFTTNTESCIVDFQIQIVQLLHLCFAFRSWTMLIRASYVLWLQLLADGVIPNEYGINPQQKLKIGSKVGFST